MDDHNKDLKQMFFEHFIMSLNALGVSAEIHRDVLVAVKGSPYVPFILIPTAAMAITLNASESEAGILKKLGFDVVELEVAYLNVTTAESSAKVVSQTRVESKKRTLIRVNLCHGRKTVQQPEVDGPELPFLFSQEPALKTMKAYPNYGGHRVVLRPKRKEASS